MIINIIYEYGVGEDLFFACIGITFVIGCFYSIYKIDIPKLSRIILFCILSFLLLGFIVYLSHLFLSFTNLRKEIGLSSHRIRGVISTYTPSSKLSSFVYAKIVINNKEFEINKHEISNEAIKYIYDKSDTLEIVYLESYPFPIITSISQIPFPPPPSTLMI